MSLPQAISRNPIAIEDISITLTDYIAVDEGPFNPASPAHKGARYNVQVRYDDGEIKVMTGNLVPHLTQAQIDGLMGFMDDLRTKAESEILP